MSVTTAPMTQITLPGDLVHEIEEVVAETGYERDVLLRAAVRRFVDSERRWRELQAYGAERAKALGIETEEDLEAFHEALDEDDNPQ
jgi:metal-responsive CopG/Arc/MetJ family transcriptional regulator